MNTITQKYRILPWSRKQKIEDTQWHLGVVEGFKAFQLITNEIVRIAAHIEDYPEFRNAKGAPDFTKLNRLISQWRTNKTGLDNLEEFKYYKVKTLKDGGVRIINKCLPKNRYMNEDGECWAYELLNSVSARALNHICSTLRASWFTKGKTVKFFAPITRAGLGWSRVIRKRLPVHPAHICDGSSIKTSNTISKGKVVEGEYKLEVNEDDPMRSTLHHIAGIKEKMRLVVHRPLMGKPKTAAVKKEGDEFYLCLTIELDPNTIPAPPQTPTKTIGLDFGIKSHVADDRNNVFNFPKDKNLEKKIIKIQQKLSIQTIGSNNWKKTKQKLAKLKRQQTRIHDGQIHNFTSKITKDYDGIAYEDYKPLRMIAQTQKDPTLYNAQKQAINKKALEGGIYKIKSQLAYKSLLQGKIATPVDPAYTTQDCSSCGYRNTELSNNVEIREWDCPECGAHHDRDQNAAQNIKKVAFG